jgi:4-hydroxybenzoate polyprenyltransferase
MAIEERTLREPALALRHLRTARGLGYAALEGMRPRQWTKNLLIFAGILFAAKIDDAHRWLEVVVAFVAFCAASSASYLMNDVRDAADDRHHPVKRFRPVADGRLPARTALALAGLLASFAVALSTWLGPRSLALLLGFLLIQIGYSLGLKRVALVDVIAIGSLFTIRATAGAAAVKVAVSPWLLLCAFLLALFLGLAKRRGELARIQTTNMPGRAVLKDYSLELLDQLISIVAASAIAAYSLYTFTGAQSHAMMLTIPFVLFGLFRYLLLVHKLQLGEEPERVLLSDTVTLLNVAVWAVTVATILFVT